MITFLIVLAVYEVGFFLTAILVSIFSKDKTDNLMCSVFWFVFWIVLGFILLHTYANSIAKWFTSKEKQ